MNTRTDCALSSYTPDSFFAHQLASWPEAAARYSRLDGMLRRPIRCGGRQFTLIHNPDRAVSTCAPADSEAIARRPCFLCRTARPPMQHAMSVEGTRFELLVNPFPIFPRHFTIVSSRHEPQHFDLESLHIMARMAAVNQEYTVFYNGPRCGASAPDHMHLQMLPSRFLPLQNDIDHSGLRRLKQSDSAMLAVCATIAGRPVIAEGDSPEAVAGMMAFALSMMPKDEDAPEAPVNLYAEMRSGRLRMTAIARGAHRPSCYGPDGILFSPGAVDMAGAIILPRRSDYEMLTSGHLESMLAEVCASEFTFNQFILNCISHELPDQAR